MKRTVPPVCSEGFVPSDPWNVVSRTQALGSLLSTQSQKICKAASPSQSMAEDRYALLLSYGYAGRLGATYWTVLPDHSGIWNISCAVSSSNGGALKPPTPR